MAQEFFSFLSFSLHQRATCAAARFSRYFSILHFHHFIIQMCLSPNLQCLKMFYVFIWSRSPNETWEKDELKYFWLSGPSSLYQPLCVALWCSCLECQKWWSKVIKVVSAIRTIMIMKLIQHETEDNTERISAAKALEVNATPTTTTHIQASSWASCWFITSEICTTSLYVQSKSQHKFMSVLLQRFPFPKLFFPHVLKHIQYS